MKTIKRLLFVIVLLPFLGIIGCSTNGVDTTAPTVISTIPANAATDVAINTNIGATFSEPMDTATLTATSVTLKQGATAIAGSLSYSGNAVTFNPTTNLAYNTEYTATITVAATDEAGNALEENKVWSFTTGRLLDTTAPTVSLTTPVNSATDVAINSNIGATFSEPMDPATLTSTSVTLKQGATAVAGLISYSGTTVTFNPTADLAYDTEYTATITVAATDEAGNALAENKVWSFTTVQLLDTTAPTVSSTNPADLATGVVINSNIMATFNEPMDTATLTSTSVTLSQGATAVAGSISYSGTTVTFNPTADLAYDTEYTATITVAATDEAGNALAENKVWSFTTVLTPDTSAPTVSSTMPANAATDVAINSNIRANFSEAMDHATIVAANVTLKQGSTAVNGTVTYDIPNHVAIFAPAENLVSGTEYTATVTTSVTDLAGNTLATNKVWSFTTAASGSGPAPVSLGTAGNFTLLAKTAISTVPASNITGDVGLSPAAETYITGFSLTDATGYATSPQVTGFIYAADMTPPTPTRMTTAISDMETAYTDAAGRSTPDFSDLGAGEIGGSTLTPGLYTWGSSVTVSSDFTIDGNANDVWIFQISGDLGLSSAVNVTLSGGAQAENIFWQVAGTVTLGTTAHFEGIVLSQTAIILNTGSTINGRLLAQSAIALDQSTVTEPTP